MMPCKSPGFSSEPPSAESFYNPGSNSVRVEFVVILSNGSSWHSHLVSLLGLTLKCQVQVKSVYVKGYGVDERKISEIMKVDPSDGRIDIGVQKILNHVDRESHWLLSGRSLDGCSYIVISFGKDAFSNNLEELEKKPLPSPKYLQAMDVVFYGPAVFEFVSW